MTPEAPLGRWTQTQTRCTTVKSSKQPGHSTFGSSPSEAAEAELKCLSTNCLSLFNKLGDVKHPSSPFEDDQFLIQTLGQLSSNYQFTHILLVGDFNGPKASWIALQGVELGGPFAAALLEVVRQNAWTQHVAAPTRYRPGQLPSLLDLVITNERHFVDQSKIKPKKTRKLRGHVSHGHGRVGKHRKHPGGRGNAGLEHHHRINMDKYHPGYIGKVGMRHYHYKKNPYFCPAINIEKIWSLVSQDTYEKYKSDGDGKAPVIDCVKKGLCFALVFRDEGDIICVPQIDKALTSNNLNTGVLKAVQCSPHYFTNGKVEQKWREWTSLSDTSFCREAFGELTIQSPTQKYVNIGIRFCLQTSGASLVSSTDRSTESNAPLESRGTRVVGRLHMWRCSNA
ncbi:hypothetical protein T265_02543 [Opisthorchis viverrini]|uniref:Large ribosomal subunit protein uL15 n=1 Tax=Opisthorchis viverrini TaxID=6198 RepID=A0A074ZZ24_OPIVI|nr:hypothetical protein T265_02543 [Opisthorchis viverrini]KER31227.1 hypothetical protein T265_02543 [Opisthorchis viverrini]